MVRSIFTVVAVSGCWVRTIELRWSKLCDVRAKCHRTARARARDPVVAACWLRPALRVGGQAAGGADNGWSDA